MWELTAYFYRNCISLDNEDFYEHIVEMVASMMFKANDGAIFNLVKALFVA